MNKPIIGITLDAEKGGKKGISYSPLPWYALRKEYFSIISSLGAIPIALPHENIIINDYINLIDGLILTGGDFDIPPELYGQQNIHNSVIIKSERTAFEYELAQKVIAQNIPILGICAGEQLLNVILGGSLIQHIPDEIENSIEHQQTTPRTEAAHDVTIVRDTILYSIVGEDKLMVNSNHHQAVKTVGENVVINAVASDGVIEGIEYTKHPFCIGVEWHPELEVNKGDRKIFEAFIKASLKNNCK